ncbi:serine hydrolase domain-containing protein [Streptomyces orinoci]|uniref:Serine hydrolase domain-containing protein n=1 Tax=Streptomyces orinoci TaxID=67339 RepID=A0ABV3K1Y4_STRON|nr:serine hydrolase domain-containing protein [Streptomyces orinoci]
MTVDELLPTTRRALLHRAATAQREGRLPSLSAAVIRGRETVWSIGRGEVAGRPPTTDTQYRIGSLTKTLVAVLVLRLREEGLLDLGDPLEKHLETTEGGEATIAQLLSHTSGLAAEARGPWWERTEGALRPQPADVFGAHPRRHPAGRIHHYSNPGYALLGALVERLRGAPWHQVLRQEVLRPLGMERTGYAPRAPHADGWAVHPWADALLPEPAVDTGLMAPAGQLWSTTADLSRFAAFLLHGDDRVLGADTLAEMRAPMAGPQGADWSGGYGLGIQLLRRDGRLLHGHTGSMPGFVACLWTSPRDDLATVVLANATSGDVAGPAADLLDTVARLEPRIPEPWRPAPDLDPALLELTGPWYWGTQPMTVRLRPDGTLDLAPLDGGHGRAATFRPGPDGTFTGLDGYYAGEPLRPVRRPDGTLSHLDIGTFVLTRRPYAPEDAIPGGVDEQGWR